MKKINRSLILLFTCLVLFWKSHDQAYAYPSIHSAGAYHTCAWDGRMGSKIKCWTSSWAKSLNEDSPEVGQLESLVSGAFHNCAVYRKVESGQISKKRTIQCWSTGSDDYHIEEIPVVPDGFEPIDISSGQWHVCGLWLNKKDETISRCWGRSSSRESVNQDEVMLDGISFKNPSAVFAAEGMSCAVHTGSTRLRCWGQLQFDRPLSDFPRVDKNETDLICIRNDAQDQADCFTNIHGFTNISVERINPHWHCRLSDRQTSCRKRDHSNNQWEEWKIIDSFTDARDLSLGQTRVCASGYFGLNCIGDERFAKSMPSPEETQFLGTNFRSVADLPFFLHRLRRYVYKEDAQLLSKLIEILQYEPQLQQETEIRKFLFVIRPLLGALDYEVLQKYFLPPSLLRVDQILADLNSESQSLDFKKSDQMWLAKILVDIFKTSQIRMTGDLRRKIFTDLKPVEEFVVEQEALRGEPGQDETNFTCLDDGVLQTITHSADLFILDPYLNMRVPMISRVLMLLKVSSENKSLRMIDIPTTRPLSGPSDSEDENKNNEDESLAFGRSPFENTPVPLTISSEFAISNAAWINQLSRFHATILELKSSLRPLDHFRLKLILNDIHNIDISLRSHELLHASILFDYKSLHQRLKRSKPFFESIETVQNASFLKSKDEFLAKIVRDRGLDLPYPTIVRSNSKILKDLVQQFIREIKQSNSPAFKDLVNKLEIIFPELLKLHSDALSAEEGDIDIQVRAHKKISELMQIFKDESACLFDLATNRSLYNQYFEILQICEEILSKQG